MQCFVQLVGLVDTGLLVRVEGERHERAVEGVAHALGILEHVRHIVLQLLEQPGPVVGERTFLTVKHLYAVVAARPAVGTPAHR